MGRKHQLLNAKDMYIERKSSQQIVETNYTTEWQRKAAMDSLEDQKHKEDA